MKNKKLTIWVSLFVFFIMLIFSTGALANAKQKTPSDLLEFLKQTYGYSFVDERAKAAVSYDLNSDGKNEYILWGASCGTGGCNYGIFKKNKNSYINILTYNENNNLTSKIYLQFEAKVLNNVTLPAVDRKELVAFQKKTNDLNRAVNGAIEVSTDLKSKVEILKTAIKQTENAPQSLIDAANKIINENTILYRKLVDDEVLSNRNEPVYPSISARVSEIVYGMWSTTSAPTASYRQNYQIAAEEFKPVLDNLKRLVEVDLKNIENEMNRLNSPWTPGRVPDWKE